MINGNNINASCQDNVCTDEFCCQNASTIAETIVDDIRPLCTLQDGTLGPEGCIPRTCTNIDEPYPGCFIPECTISRTGMLGPNPSCDGYPLCANTFSNVKNSIPRDCKSGNYIKPQSTNVQTCCFGENKVCIIHVT